LRDVLKVIATRLFNLEQRKYFPSPSESFLAEGGDAKLAASAASKSTACADAAFKSAAAAACQ